MGYRLWGEKIRSVSSFSIAIRKYVCNFTAENTDGHVEIRPAALNALNLPFMKRALATVTLAVISYILGCGAWGIRPYNPVRVRTECAQDGKATDGNHAREKKRLTAYATGNTLYVKDVADGTEIIIYSITGSVIMRGEAENGRLDIGGLKNGVYIVRAGGRAAKITIKN